VRLSEYTDIYLRVLIFLTYDSRRNFLRLAHPSGAAGLMLHFARRGLYVAMGILTHTAVSALLT